MSEPAQSFWIFSYREARAITSVVAVVLWTLAGAFLFAGPTIRSVAGPLKGGDFVFFYTLGAAASTGDSSLLYDVQRLHARQAMLVPESAPDVYLPVYPPQMALLFAPFAKLPFRVAVALWTLVIIGLYAYTVHATWHSARDALPDGRFVALAAAAFPPFWSLVLHGHNTVVPLAIFFLAWKALEREQRYLAGVTLGFLALKPQFGLALALVVLVTREWSMLAGVLTSALCQLAATAILFDASVVMECARFMRGVLTTEHLIEPKPYEMHSIRAITRLAPPQIGMLLWLVTSAVVLERTVKVWVSEAPVNVRFGILVLASVLVSPHLFVYDATVLVLPLLWIGGWIQRDSRANRALTDWFWPLTFWLGVTLLLPIARMIYVQLSVVLLAWMLIGVSRHVLANGAPRREYLAGSGAK